MILAEIVGKEAKFYDFSFSQQIKFFMWHLHEHRTLPFVQLSAIRDCFSELSLTAPKNLHDSLESLTQKKPPEVLRTSKGYALEARTLAALRKQHGERANTVVLHKTLTELPGKVKLATERVFLEEALVCFKHKAFRSAIVMAWNFAYDHLCSCILNAHLAEFNVQLPKSFPKADISVVAKRDDFQELKESQVLQICKSANIISGSLHKLMKEKLDRRNISAHPSGLVINDITAEEFIRDLVDNVVLKLA